MSQENVKGLKFAILPTGRGENDPGFNFHGYAFGDMYNKDRPREWMSFPLFCVLIRHPDLGNILYDCGPGIGDENEEHCRRSHEAFISNPAIMTRDEFVDRRLQQIGLSTDDIDMILISHFHWDHVGGMELFKGTKAIKNVYAPEKDFEYALKMTHISSKGYSDGLYFRWNIDIDGCEYHLIREDQEFARGIDLLLLEGHTPAVMGLILHCEEKTYIFPSDAITAQLNFGPPVVPPGNIYDSLGFYRTVDKVRKLQQKYNAEMVYQHDPWQEMTNCTEPTFFC